MKTLVQMAVVFGFGVTVGSLTIPALSAQTRTTEVKELIRTDLGTWCPGKEVGIVLQESGPGTSSRHYHPGHSYSYVIEGSETRMVVGTPPQVARVGDVIHELPMEVGETQNIGPVKLLVFSILEKGQPVTTRVP